MDAGVSVPDNVSVGLGVGLVDAVFAQPAARKIAKAIMTTAAARLQPAELLFHLVI
jgi:hypothetical protein